MRKEFYNEELLIAVLKYLYTTELDLNPEEYLHGMDNKETLPKNTFKLDADTTPLSDNQINYKVLNIDFLKLHKDAKYFQGFVDFGFDLEFTVLPIKTLVSTTDESINAQSKVEKSKAKKSLTQEVLAKSVSTIKENYKNRLPLLKGIDLTKQEIMLLQENLHVEIKANENTKKVIDKRLYEYIYDYENNQLFLPNKNIISLKRHYEIYRGVISFAIEMFSPTNVVLEANTNHEFEKNSFHRPIEFYFLMEQKGMIKIHSLTLNKGIVVCNAEVLRDHKEMDDLYFNWIRFGALSFNPKTGHAKNGNLAVKHFPLNGSSYKAMKLFLEEWDKWHSFSDIETACFTDTSDIKKQLKDRINSLIDKQIRVPLKLNHPDSKVNILGADNAFKLTALP